MRAEGLDSGLRFLVSGGRLVGCIDWGEVMTWELVVDVVKVLSLDAGFDSGSSGTTASFGSAGGNIVYGCWESNKMLSPLVSWFEVVGLAFLATVALWWNQRLLFADMIKSDRDQK